MFSASEVASYIAMVGVLSVVAQVRFLFLSVVQDFDCLNIINICFTIYVLDFQVLNSTVLERWWGHTL